MATKLEYGIIASLALIGGAWGYSAYTQLPPTAAELAAGVEGQADATLGKTLNSDDVCKRDDVIAAATPEFQRAIIQRWEYNASPRKRFFVENEGRTLVNNVPAQFIEVHGGGIARQGELATTVTCRAVIKMDASNSEEGNVVLEFHDFTYVVIYTKPTADLGTKAFSVQADDARSFKQVFLNSKPIEQALAKDQILEPDLEGQMTKEERDASRLALGGDGIPEGEEVGYPEACEATNDCEPMHDY